MTLRTYYITFSGDAVPAIRTAFEDFEVTESRGSTTLRGKNMDQSALYGAFDRLQNMGLELLQVTNSDPACDDESTTGAGGVVERRR